MHICRNTLSLICLLVALSWLGGCSGISQYPAVAPPKLTLAEEIRVGTAVEETLIQMLGGPYHDKNLSTDLGRYVRSALPFKVSVADRGVPALYPLPGGRVIVTRGLLAEVNSRAKLTSLLTHAMQLSNGVYQDRPTRNMMKMTQEVLSSPGSIYDPDSATIRLARLFEHEACVQDCLATALFADVTTEKRGSTAMPESIRRLSGLQPGYDLLTTGGKDEEADNQASAIALYLQAAATTPDEPRILGTLGLAYLRAGQLQSARLHLQKAVKLQPDYYRTQMGLGYIYLQQGHFQKANQTLAVSVRLLPVTENLFLLAEAREKSGDVKGASLLYRLVVESDRAGKLGRTSASRLEPSAGVP